MPSIFSHVAIPLALGLGMGREKIPPFLMMTGIVACIVPDLDCISFVIGIPYESDFGHRGASHSILFSILFSLLLSLTLFKDMKAKAFWFIFASVLSHGLLDTFTNGGHGIALLWPFSSERFFAPYQVIKVSPIGKGFFSERGLAVIVSEIIWVWLPCAVIAGTLFGYRKLRKPV